MYKLVNSEKNEMNEKQVKLNEFMSMHNAARVKHFI